MARGDQFRLKIISFPRSVLLDGVEVEMTDLEFRLLWELVMAEGRVVRRQELFESVWGYNEEFNSNSLEVFVSRLRAKLEVDGLKVIHTVRGVGYKYEVVDG